MAKLRPDELSKRQKRRLANAEPIPPNYRFGKPAPDINKPNGRRLLGNKPMLGKPVTSGTRRQSLDKLEAQTAFLEAYTKTGTISGAARASGVGKRTHYAWLSDPEYQQRFADAHETAVDAAEQELRRRGVYGYERPVFFQGEQVGSSTEYSDACLIFYLKGRRQDVFSDRIQHSGPGGGPLQYVDISNIPTARLEQMRQWILEASTIDVPALAASSSEDE